MGAYQLYNLHVSYATFLVSIVSYNIQTGAKIIILSIPAIIFRISYKIGIFYIDP